METSLNNRRVQVTNFNFKNMYLSKIKKTSIDKNTFKTFSPYLKVIPYEYSSSLN